MAASSYYNQQSHMLHDDHDQQQHLLSPSMSSTGFPSPGYSSGHPSPLKPLHLVSQEQVLNHHHSNDLDSLDQLKVASDEDAVIKARIRRLRVISRVLAFFISIAVLVPITMTLVKFQRTKNTWRTITLANGDIITRTAWAKDTRAWPTLAYFAVAAISTLLNFITIFSYKYGVEKANTANYITQTFSWFVMLGNLIVWSVAAGMYRREMDKGGRNNDLWGWTCSAAARAIQKDFAHEVDFDKFCNVQSASWYVGLVQVGAALFTVVIYVMVFMRKRSKSNLNRHMRLNGFGPAE